MKSQTAFDHSTLLISIRSPFARRVRIAFRECGIPYEEKVFDVFKPEPLLLEVNPLRRVPALVLKGGQVLVDSHLILDRFYDRFSPAGSAARATAFPSGEAGLRAAHWSGLAVGFCEKIVEWFIDSTRPGGHSDPDLVVELRETSQSLFARLERDLASTSTEFMGGASLCQADIDLAAMLTYYGVRVSTDWREDFPRAAKYLDALEARPSFCETAPPPIFSR